MLRKVWTAGLVLAPLVVSLVLAVVLYAANQLALRINLEVRDGTSVEVKLAEGPPRSWVWLPSQTPSSQRDAMFDEDSWALRGNLDPRVTVLLPGQLPYVESLVRARDVRSDTTGLGGALPSQPSAYLSALLSAGVQFRALDLVRSYRYVSVYNLADHLFLLGDDSALYELLMMYARSLARGSVEGRDGGSIPIENGHRAFADFARYLRNRHFDFAVYELRIGALDRARFYVASALELIVAAGAVTDRRVLLEREWREFENGFLLLSAVLYDVELSFTHMLPAMLLISVATEVAEPAYGRIGGYVSTRDLDRADGWRQRVSYAIQALDGYGLETKSLDDVGQYLNLVIEFRTSPEYGLCAVAGRFEMLRDNAANEVVRGLSNLMMARASYWSLRPPQWDAVEQHDCPVAPAGADDRSVSSDRTHEVMDLLVDGLAQTSVSDVDTVARREIGYYIRSVLDGMEGSH